MKQIEQYRVWEVDKRLHADDVARQAVALRLQIKRKFAALDADAHGNLALHPARRGLV